ncbi:hypothetical protein GQ600_4635 [Phytophthora cactorum]|nr:hypothetical protein GQ600_4635 [Phytophthora cactorum]
MAGGSFYREEGRKQLCRVLIASLEPHVLREDVKRTALFKTRRAQEDEVVLHDLILEKALDQEKSVPAPKAYEA